MSREATLVHYPPTADHQIRLVIEQVSADGVDRSIAREVLALLGATYTARFEGREAQARLPRGTIAALYNPEDPDAVIRQRDRMQQYIDEQRTQYWYVSSVNDEGNTGVNQGRDTLPGMIKLSPSRPTLLHHIGAKPDNLYINDVLVNPHSQGHGLGTGLMHVAVTHAGFSANAVAVLDVYRGSSVNRWFEMLGLRESPDSPTDLAAEFGGHTLPQVRYVSEDGLSLGGMSLAMQNRDQWLASARPSYAGL